MIDGSALLDGTALPLESTSDRTQEQLLVLLNACESGNSKEPNPLEDYRLLFNFDLDIYVDGSRVDSLSKRLGVGSNGEHLVPFYVIAGASLANAYGMKAGCEHDGAAIMLIDEAFHGFDAQNTYVTGLFLRSLGLQLVMAAPDADVGKIGPVLDLFYDLNRFGSDVFAHEKHVKPASKRLFTRDIPGQNPQLEAERGGDRGDAAVRCWKATPRALCCDGKLGTTPDVLHPEDCVLSALPSRHLAAMHSMPS